MQRLWQWLGSLLLFVFLVGVMLIYIRDRSLYDADKICERQHDVPHDVCLHDIALAQSAGW